MITGRTGGFLFLLSFLYFSRMIAQYAPPAGQAGTTAISADSSIFVAWAKSSVLERGWMQINAPELGNASFGAAEDALGVPDINVTSLGDGGRITLGFEKSIQNGSGPDFAVFENSFSDDFLELAHVEVSSDGVNYARFPSASLTPSDVQVNGFGILQATSIHNLAGKYMAFFGTPFDLDDINDELVNIDSINYIRIVDVIGCIDPATGTFDGSDRMINDPWPTPFPSSGFDLDAVGVIHEADNLGVKVLTKQTIQVIPNPFVDRISFQGKYPEGPQHIQVFDMMGKMVYNELLFSWQSSIYLGFLPKGAYQIVLRSNSNISTTKIIKQ
ncbi:MAG: cell surface protein [Bacteroidetes bacterium]|nr:MAG: cell surface protein [Bacteroidota bacterium]